MAFLSLLLIAVLVAVDQLTKYVVVSNMELGEHIEVIPGLLDWCYIHNSGAAFGLLQNQRWIFLVITGLVAVVAIGFLFYKKCDNWMLRTIIILLVGGGVGNMIDRIALGYVVDFISLSFFPPIFNFADICVCVGAALMVVYIIWGDKWFARPATEETKQENEIEPSDQ